MQGLKKASLIKNNLNAGDERRLKVNVGMWEIFLW